MENKIEKLVPDTSIIIEGLLSKKLQDKELKIDELIIHEAVLAELEHQANYGREIGTMGLEEIKKLRELSSKLNFNFTFKGKRPGPVEIKHASMGEIDSLIRELAWDEGATLITGDKVQSKVGEAKGLSVIYVEPVIKTKKIALEKYFDKDTMSVHLRENIRPYAKKGVPGNWKFVHLSEKKLTQEQLKDMAKEIIEEAKMRNEGFIEIERRGSTIIQLGNYRIVITRPPLSDAYEITAVRPIKKLKLEDYKLNEKLLKRISEQAEGILIAGSPGMGKCHGKDTLILMYNGSIKMVQNIKTCDLVMGPDSKPRRVLGINKGYGNLYQIKPVKGDDYVANEEHILSLKYNKNKDEKTVNISVKDFLNSPLYFKERCKGYRTGIEFSGNEVPINPYFLGLWLGDGLSASTRISNSEPEILEFLNDYATENGMVLRQHSYKEGISQTYGITTGQQGGRVINPLLDLMRSLNLINNKHIPEIYKINDYETRLQILAGLIDTDGYLTSNCFEIATKFERLKDDILYLARSLGFAAYTKEKIIENKIYHRIRISGDIALIPTRIKRKAGHERKQIKNVLRTGIKAKFIGKGEFYGFELDKDGLYCLGDFTVTHNSTFATAVAEFYVSKEKTVKTIEAPRDLDLSDDVTQYAISHGTPQEIHDILLLTRPDYTIFDEMRNIEDFRLFADLRLSGIGLVGVVHATDPIDAIQRFIGKTELGVIPHVIDTVVFIKNGMPFKVLSVLMTVKVPSGMTEADLARPIVEIKDFETGKLEYEIYSYGEETVVVPVVVNNKQKPSYKFAAKEIENELYKYGFDVKVELVSDNEAEIYLPEEKIARIIGKEGKTIIDLEKKLGIRLTVKELNNVSEEEIPYKIQEDSKFVRFYFDNKYSDKKVDFYIDDERVFTANTGKKAEVRIHKKSFPGKHLTNLLDSGKNLIIKV